MQTRKDLRAGTVVAVTGDDAVHGGVVGVSWARIACKAPGAALSYPSPTLLSMNMKDWLRDLKREIDRRVTAATSRGALTSADEAMECRTAPNGERVHFSIRGMLENGDGSQDPGWMEPAWRSP